MHQEQTDHSPHLSGDHPSEIGKMLFPPVRQRHRVLFSSSLFFLSLLLLYSVLGGAVACGMTKFGTRSLNWRYPSLEEGPGEKAMPKRYRKPKKASKCCHCLLFLLILSPHRAAFFFLSILFQVVTLTNLHWFLYPCHLKTTLSVDGELFLHARPAALSNVTSVCSH